MAKRPAAVQQNSAPGPVAPEPPIEIAPLRLALPKGRILDEALVLFARAGLDLSVVAGKSRRLVHRINPAPGSPLGEAPLLVYVVRDSDVPTYVEYGAADLGICGRDVLEEQGRDLYEPLDLGIGRCRMSVAEPALHQQAGAGALADRARLHLRVATKFPNIARRYLESRGIVAEVIALHGSIELGPLTGLADRIVDVVSTGETLRQNDLREVETILEVSARLVVNRASLKLRRLPIDSLVGRLRAAVAVGA